MNEKACDLFYAHTQVVSLFLSLFYFDFVLLRNNERIESNVHGWREYALYVCVCVWYGEKNFNKSDSAHWEFQAKQREIKFKIEMKRTNVFFTEMKMLLQWRLVKIYRIFDCELE